MSSKADGELYSHELDRYLNQRDAECGARSGMGGFIGVLERGGVFGEPNTDPYHDGQVGLGPTRSGSFAHDRLMLPRWSKLTRSVQEILVSHYVASSPAAAFGEGSEGRTRWPKGVSARLAQFAGVAFYLAWSAGPEALARLLKACEKGNDQGVRPWQAKAEQAIREAHRAYYAVVDAEGPKVTLTKVGARTDRVERWLRAEGI